MDIDREVIVAKMPGSRYFLAGGHRLPVSFQGLSERTLFFETQFVERDLKKLGIAPETVELRKASLHVEIH